MADWELILQILGTGGSLLLTGFLVLMYRKQTQLNQYEINRDARKIHTDVLRERVQYWLELEEEDENAQPRSDIPAVINVDSDRLPEVHRTSIKPAPDEGSVTFAGEEEEFRVVPGKYEDDLYMQDFLDNHAPDVQTLVNDIESLHEEFESLRTEFLDEYPTPERIVNSKFIIEPIPDNFQDWLFEKIIELERGYYEEEELKPDSGLAGRYGPDEGILYFHASSSESSKVVYKCKLETVGREEFRELGLREDVVEAIQRELATEIDEIDEGDPYDIARDAARILEETAVAIEELRNALVIYEGKPIYGGNCQYLDEVEIEEIAGL